MPRRGRVARFCVARGTLYGFRVARFCARFRAFGAMCNKV